MASSTASTGTKTSRFPRPPRDTEMTTPIPFIDLKEQYRQIRRDVLRRIEAVLEHGQFILGPEIEEIEQQLAAFVGVKHCITVGSGTDALLVSMMAWGIGPGDEIITSPFSFISAAEVAVLLGAKPVFVDIDPATYNMDPSRVEAVITHRTKLLVPVSLYGQVADMAAYASIAERHGLRLLEDACQSFGGVSRGRRSCSFLHAGATSFFPSKPLGCYGDGGAIFTAEDTFALTCRQLRAHGQRKRYDHGIVGINARFDTLQAAVLLAKMPLLDAELAQRQVVAERYTDMLRGIPEIVVPYIAPENVSAWAQYSIQVPNRAAVQRALKADGIPTAVHYPLPIHLQPAICERFGSQRGQYPVSEAVSERIMSIPMDPWLTEDAQRRVVESLARAAAGAPLPQHP
jgi:UDP-2-acetamido-2-deoxy-ribo-hexuluronate aminotransferase